MKNNSSNIESAYQNAVQFTKSHYENFPVISLFVKKELRKHVAIFYQFARQADDIVDEGNANAATRLKELDAYENKLSESLKNNFKDDFWAGLKNTIDLFQLSHENFFNLLKAFRQDVLKSRYKDFDELLGYCKNSANPVGRVILELNQIKDDEANKFSDEICTALQLTNFWQDVGVDLKKDRIYLPLDEMQNFGVDEKNLELNANNANIKELLKLQVQRTRELFCSGRNLIPKLSGRLKYQIHWTILGGEKILDKIEQCDFNTIKVRPKLNKADYFLLMIKSMFEKR